MAKNILTGFGKFVKASQFKWGTPGFDPKSLFLIPINLVKGSKPEGALSLNFLSL